MRPRFFATPQAFRAWLAKHHRGSAELLVGLHKKGSGKASITWPEAVDEALCFGWIDGVRKRLDDASYTVRFTPRRAGSTWSAVNIARAAALEAAGRMKPAGAAVFRQRSAGEPRAYSYEQDDAPQLERPHQKKFQAHREAWSFFQAQAPSYRRKACHWVISAKSEEARLRRLDRLIEASSRGKRA